MTVPVTIKWNVVPEADRYTVYVQPGGGHITALETVNPSVIIQIPENTPTLVYITYRQGDLESITCEEMHVYIRRW